MAAEFEGETPMNSQPVSPASEYLSSSILSLSIIAVLEFGVPIDNPILRARSLLRDLFLPVNPRFSSIMGMIVGVMSYANQLRVAVKVEKDFVDAQKLKACIEQSFAKMLQAAC